ncbi:MAG: acyltransferase [Gemmatimonadetes bacterium]|nr:acyltransferase [Gemmatimonadota bacterium]
MNAIARELACYMDAVLAAWPGVSGSKIRLWFLSRGLASLGRGCYVGNGCIVDGRENICFGDRVAVGDHAFFVATGGPISVGNRVTFTRNAHVNTAGGGRIEIGNDVLVGPNVVMRTADHRFQRTDVPIREQGHVPADIIIEDDVWLAANVVVLGGVHIGRGAIAAAGAVVTRDVPPLSVVGGVPAKVLKMRTGRETVQHT